MTKTLAEEDARKGITVNVIAPNCIDTPMMYRISADFLQDLLNRHPMLQLDKPEEILWRHSWPTRSAAMYPAR